MEFAATWFDNCVKRGFRAFCFYDVFSRSFLFDLERTKEFKVVFVLFS